MDWVKRLFRLREQEKEFDRELEFHLEELFQENLAKGLAAEEAMRRAKLELGGREQIKDELHDLYRIPLIETFLRNLKLSGRLIRRSPGVSAAIVFTLMIGTGANIAVFSAVDTILVRPLPFPQSDQLVLLLQHSTEGGNPQTLVAPVRLEDWNRMSSAFQAIAGYYVEDTSETSGPLPEKLTRAFVTKRFLQVMGVSPTAGRDFTAEEQRFGGPNAILISDRLWRQRFSAAPQAIGQSLHFGKSSAAIVGVMPASFQFPDESVDIWSAVPADAPYAQNRTSTWYTAIGRLKPAVKVGQGVADIALVQSRLGRQFPASDEKLNVEVQPLKETTVGSSRRSLWMLFGAVTLLLVIACANIAAVLLARGTERQHEIAVRYSLGASQRAIVGQLLTEVLVLASLGAAAGLGIAALVVRWLRTFPSGLPRANEIAVDWRMLVYAIVCALTATIVCGLLPAWRTARYEIAHSLAAGGKAHVSSGNPMQWALVTVQVALAVTLLLGAALLLRSFYELGRVNAGFDVRHVLAFRVDGSYAETTDMKRLQQRINRTLETLRSLPGVKGAATSSGLPGVPSQFPTEVSVAGSDKGVLQPILANSRFVSSGYFSTMQIPMLAGAECGDTIENKYALVNQSFVSRFFGTAGPIGRQIRMAGGLQTPLSAEIRGVVADAREQGINVSPSPTVYWCVNAPSPTPNYLVRTAGDPAAMAGTVRQVMRTIEPSRSVYEIRPLNEHLSDAFSETRMRTVLLSLSGLIAISLACVGVYGTLVYLVNSRRREIGLRLALGAQRERIAESFLAQGLRVCAIGCVAGVMLALSFTRLLSGMLYGVPPNDPTTIAAVVVLVTIVGTLAATLPAVRAAKTDPMQVLREG